PAFAVGEIDPIRILAADWESGRLRLKLSRAPEIDWMQIFKNPRGNWGSLQGSGPESFQFGGDTATVRADEQYAQQIIDYAKGYLDMANRSYQTELAMRAKQEERAYREKLTQEQAAAETRARVVSKLKI
ncbi:MAG TPA: hypothetical protein VK663_02500, partial [Burkholderiales bacterium]|nr:hypothetical protein [Burkholderiales bacterium]